MARVMMLLRPSKGGAWLNASTLSKALVARGHEVAIVGPHEAHRRDLDGVELIQLAVEHRVSPIADSRAVAAFARVVRRWKPDLIHAHGSKGGVIARLGRIASPRTPVVFTPHQLAFTNWITGGRSPVRYRAIERALAPLASRILCVCEDERRLVEALGAGRKARVVYNGIDPPAAARPDPAIRTLANGAPVILAVSELHERKGLPTLIDATPALLDAIPDAVVAIAGQGPERGRLAARISDAGLCSSVHLLGQLDDIPSAHAAADVFVNPAWAEAFPYGIIEAMAAGMPIVATDVGGCGEAIEDDVTGRLVPARDSAAIAGALIALLQDRGFAQELGRHARGRMLARFTAAKMVAGTLSIYSELGIVL